MKLSELFEEVISFEERKRRSEEIRDQKAKEDRGVKRAQHKRNVDFLKGEMKKHDVQQRRKSMKVVEKWDKEVTVAKSERGKYKNKTIAELKSMLKNAKTKEKKEELNFAIRAKQKDKWGEVK